MTKIKSIGIIAEDDSDFDSSAVLIRRITNKNNLTFKKQVSGGCGKLKRKLVDYACALGDRGCNLVIVLHDLDRNSFKVLQADLSARLKGAAVPKYFICIPIQEMEAWFLSDPIGLKNTMNLKRVPRLSGLPENVNDPKEKLRDCIRFCSNKEKFYLNTRHNKIIAQGISIDLIKQKCPSFKLLFDFLAPLKF